MAILRALGLGVGGALLGWLGGMGLSEVLGLGLERGVQAVLLAIATGGALGLGVGLGLALRR